MSLYFRTHFFDLRSAGTLPAIVGTLPTKFFGKVSPGSRKPAGWQAALPEPHTNRRSSALGSAHLACWRSRPRERGLLCKDCFGETPKPTRETRALPGSKGPIYFGGSWKPPLPVNCDCAAHAFGNTLEDVSLHHC